MTSKPGLLSSRMCIIAWTVLACRREGTPPHGPVDWEILRIRKRVKEVRMKEKETLRWSGHGFQVQNSAMRMSSDWELH